MATRKASTGPSRCAFCGAAGASKEHVFADWITDVLPGDGAFTTAGSGGRRTKQSNRLAVISRAPCRACNNGWMSELEGQAKPLLTPAIRGEATTWLAAERLVLARWAMKTALMADRTHSEHYVPDDHFEHLYSTQHPHLTTVVWLTSLGFPGERTTLEAALFHRTRLHMESPSASFDGYRITFSVGYLVMQVFGAATDERLTLERSFAVGDAELDDCLRQCWPSDGRALAWPPRHGFDAAALAQLA